MLRRLLVILGALAWASVVDAEPPTLNYFFPGGVPRDATTPIEAHGKFDRWPLQAWCGTPGVEIEVGADKGQLRVSVGATVRPGVHWIRLFDDQGASRPRPLIVETVRELLEDTVGDDPLDVSHPLVVNGRLAKNDEVDSYRCRLEAGQTLVASVVAHRHLRSPMDAVLQLYDVTHQVVLAQSDDAPGRDPQLVYTASEPMELAVRLFAFPETPTSRVGFAGADNYVYRLALSTQGLVEYGYPLAVATGAHTQLVPHGTMLAEGKPEIHLHEGGEHATVCLPGVPGWGMADIVDAACLEMTTSEAAVRCQVPSHVSGVLRDAKQSHTYRVQLKKGLAVRMVARARQLGFMTDPVLTVTDAAGKQLAKADDSGQQRDCQLDFTPAADGEYKITIGDLYGHAGDGYGYALAITYVKPSVRLSVADDVISGKAGEPIELVVNVERLDGYDQSVWVTAIGLPGDVMVHGSLSEPTGETAKKVTLRVVAESPQQSRMGILGTVWKAPQHVWATTSGDDAHQDLWLSILPP